MKRQFFGRSRCKSSDDHADDGTGLGNVIFWYGSTGGRTDIRGDTFRSDLSKRGYDGRCVQYCQLEKSTDGWRRELFDRKYR